MMGIRVKVYRKTKYKFYVEYTFPLSLMFFEINLIKDSRKKIPKIFPLYVDF